MTMPRKQISGSRVQTLGRAGFSTCDRGESGAALLIVLVFIVIIAVILVAFLSNSQRALQQTESSSTILKTELLGDVATAAVIDDLVDEMKAGADDSPENGAPMTVSNPRAMVPSRVLKDDGMLSNSKFANLVKQSVNGKAFFSGTAPFRYEGKKRASSAGSLDESRNQRKVSAERWNKPRLLGDASGLGAFSDAQLPDWIYITRAGAAETGGALSNASDKTPSNSKYVLGRFAYNIYRVDGLLDINVSGLDTNDPKVVAALPSKGSAAMADLRAIPGLASGSAQEKIFTWRNKQSKDDFPSLIAGLKPGDPFTATPNLWGEPAGFLRSYVDNAGTDNRFFGRQDLLKFFENEFSAAESAALPYLTTFSADLDQPSFRPDPDRPKILGNANNGGNDGYNDETNPVHEQINPAVLAVLDDQDEPVVRRRFPLNRLKYVVPNPPDVNKQFILENFGLEWTGNGWNYAEGGAIKRLHQLGNARPNMIQLLKAAISIGSLGSQATYGEPREDILRDRDSSIDHQVMRIAACIIDQYDADSYPTVITFGSDTVYGVEDLPYLYGFRIAPYRQEQLVPENALSSLTGYPRYPATDKNFPNQPLKDLYRNVVFVQPIIWNPHAPTSGDRPAAFRITAATRNPDGTFRAADVVPQARKPWWKNVGTYVNDWPSKTGNPRDRGEKRYFRPGEDYMTFTVSTDDDSPASFREPYTLKAPNYPLGSDAKAFSGPQVGLPGGEVSEPTLGAAEQNDTGESSSIAIGFRTGWCWSGPYDVTSATPVSPTNPSYLQLGLLETGGVSGGIDFALQCQMPDGNWVTYDTYDKFGNYNEYYRLDRLNSGADTINPRLMRYYMRADPRVDRLGARAPLLQPNSAGLPQGQSMRKDQSPGVISQGGWPTDSKFRFTVPALNSDRYIGLLSENKPTSLVRYSDPDGVQRLAMGGRYETSGGIVGLPMAQVKNRDYSSRPVILNRPFQSVAELGHVLRDQPWKQLDFFSPESGDAALLDMFCIYEPEDDDADPIVAGRVSLNTNRPEIIEALLRGVRIKGDSHLGDANAKTLAQALVDWTASDEATKGPFRNRSELVGKFVSGNSPGNYAYSGFSTQLDGVLSGENKVIVSQRESVLRALVEPSTTRAWTFLIDLIVQDGQFTGAASGAGDFMVRGERRLWIHVSLDRFTGDVVAKRVEEVHE